MQLTLPRVFVPEQSPFRSFSDLTPYGCCTGVVVVAAAGNEAANACSSSPASAASGKAKARRNTNAM